MLSLQTLLIAEEIQKDARRRAEHARLLKQLGTAQVISGGRFSPVTTWWQAVVRTWRGFFLTPESAPCPTC